MTVGIWPTHIDMDIADLIIVSNACQRFGGTDVRCVCIDLSALCSALLTSLLQNRTNVIHFRLSSPQRFVAVYWAFEFGICCCFL